MAFQKLSKTIFDEDENDITFKITNRSECDEKRLMRLKINMQREYYCLNFMQQLILFYICYTREILVNEDIDADTFINNIDQILENDQSNIYEGLKIELNEYKRYILINDDLKEKLKALHKSPIANWYAKARNGHFIIANYYLKYSIITFKLYDNTFNNKVILQNLLNIENISNKQIFNIILYYIDLSLKVKDGTYFGYKGLADPIHNTRNMIINNYNPSVPGGRGESAVLKDSNGIYYTQDGEYMDALNPKIILDQKFKNDIINQNFNDGYQIIDEDNYYNNINNCKRYIVELCKGDYTMISITVTESPENENDRAHFYIFKHLIFEMICEINQVYYKNLSLDLHSFAAYIFKTNNIYSTLMNSMQNILIANNIIIEENIGPRKLESCIRKSYQKIDTEQSEFKKLKDKWVNKIIPLVIDNQNISIYKINNQITTQKTYEQKYIKYKTKYNILKNKIIS